MSMNDFKTLKLSTLLCGASQKTTNEELRNAYEDFLAKVKLFSETESDFSEIYRMLNLTRIEFVYSQSYTQYEQGEKYVKISLLAESHFCD